MPQFRAKPMLERSASADLFKNTLSKIPTVFGRLAYLSSLRDRNSGVYSHYGLAAIFGRDDSRRALSDNHAQVFQQWLELPLSDKAAEIEAYLKSLEDPKALVLDHWSRSTSYRSYIPDSARKMQRVHFLKEIETLLKLFNCSPRNSK